MMLEVDDMGIDIDDEDSRAVMVVVVVVVAEGMMMVVKWTESVQIRLNFPA